LVKADVERIAALHVTASMQPAQATSDMVFAEARVGKKRLEHAYAWRSMIDASIPLAFGSDAPVEDIRPAWGIFAAITRTDHAGKPRGGFVPAQRIGESETLQAFARGAAYAVGEERERGSLTPGMWFDVSLFDKTGSDPSSWISAKPVGTVVEGQMRKTP
jgi:predicted amidohydrolase YtcJ